MSDDAMPKDPLTELRVLASEIHTLCFGHVVLLIGTEVSIMRVDNGGALTTLSKRAETDRRFDKGPIESIAAMLWNAADRRRTELARDLDGKRKELARAEEQLAAMEARIARLNVLAGYAEQPATKLAVTVCRESGCSEPPLWRHSETGELACDAHAPHIVAWVQFP